MNGPSLGVTRHSTVQPGGSLEFALNEGSHAAQAMLPFLGHLVNSDVTSSLVSSSPYND